MNTGQRIVEENLKEHKKTSVRTYKASNKRMNLSRNRHGLDDLRVICSKCESMEEKDS